MFMFGKRSKEKMVGVHADLIRVMKRALELSPVDFAITEGLRTPERQKQLVAAGASKTLNSRHITGHAVDVAAFVGSELRWDFGLYLQIAEAVRLASIELNIPIVWGACWSQVGQTSDLSSSVARYVDQKRRDGGKPLIDGPHFELWKGLYA